MLGYSRHGREKTNVLRDHFSTGSVSKQFAPFVAASRSSPAAVATIRILVVTRPWRLRSKVVHHREAEHEPAARSGLQSKWRLERSLWPERKIWIRGSLF